MQFILRPDRANIDYRQLLLTEYFPLKLSRTKHVQEMKRISGVKR